MSFNVHLSICLQTRPDIDYNRIQQRQREGEGKITLECIHQMNQRYDEWLIDGKFPKPKRRFIINGNHDIDFSLARINQKLGEFFTHLSLCDE